MKTFWVRTASAAVYAVLFIGSIICQLFVGWGRAVFAAFVLFVMVGCLFEYYRMMEAKGFKPTRCLGYVFAVLAMIFTYWYGFCSWSKTIGFLAMVLIAPVSLLIELWKKSDRPFANVAISVLPVFYIVMSLSLMYSIGCQDPEILLACIFMVWINDSFAYMGGSLVGKHKMWPRHSPGKTWEGTAIGVVACIAFGVIAVPLLFDSYMDVLDWAVLGLICSVIGTLGDLVESMLKRSVGVKDSGNIMPGHGGFLDRFDSLLMIIPFVYVYITLMFDC